MSEGKTESSNSDNEDPQQCYIPSDIENNSNVSSGEVCTIENAKSYGIFGKYNYFNDIIDKNEQNEINVHNNKTDGLKYSLCLVDKETEKAYTNCVLSTKNPWKSLSEDNEYCMLPTDITLPNYLSYSSNSNSIIEKPKDIIYITQKNKLCNETWYDWFTIPDYNIGNKISGNENQEKCYGACEIGSIPWKNPNTDDDYDKCINRDKYKYGLYKNDFYYTPHALIMLLGSSKKYLIENHIKEMKKIREKMKDLIFDNDIYNDVITNTETQENIYREIGADIGKRVKTLLSIPFDHTNIIEPSVNIQNISNKLLTKDNVISAYEIASAYHYYVSNISDSNISIGYMNWKKDLAAVSGLETTDQKFYKQLLILKKACNIMFDNKTEYSKNIFYNFLNTKLKEGDTIKSPIQFEITKDDVILSISKNHSETTDKDKTLMTTENIDKTKTIKKTDQEMINNPANLSRRASSTQIPRQKRAPILKNSTDDSTDPEKKKKKSIFEIITFIIFFLLYGILLIMLCVFIVMIIFLLWYPGSSIFNKMMLGSASFMYYVQDLLRGRYVAPSANVNLLQLQKGFLEKIIQNDLKYKK